MHQVKRYIVEELQSRLVAQARKMSLAQWCRSQTKLFRAMLLLGVDFRLLCSLDGGRCALNQVVRNKLDFCTERLVGGHGGVWGEFGEGFGGDWRW